MDTIPNSDSAEKAPEPASSQPGRGRGPGHRFQKGESGNPTGLPKPNEGDEDVEPDDGDLPRQLRDMRFVVNHPKGHDRTHAQRNYRKWLEQDLKAYMAALSQLERAHIATPRKEPAPAPQESPPPKPEVKADAGSERALALCERLLADYAADQAKEDAELAARPNAAEFAGTLQKRLQESLQREERARQHEAELQKRVDELERAARYPKS